MTQVKPNNIDKGETFSELSLDHPISYNGALANTISQAREEIDGTLDADPARHLNDPFSKSVIDTSFTARKKMNNIGLPLDEKNSVPEEVESAFQKIANKFGSIPGVGKKVLNAMAEAKRRMPNMMTSRKLWGGGVATAGLLTLAGCSSSKDDEGASAFYDEMAKQGVTAPPADPSFMDGAADITSSVASGGLDILQYFVGDAIVTAFLIIGSAILGGVFDKKGSKADGIAFGGLAALSYPVFCLVGILAGSIGVFGMSAEVGGWIGRGLGALSIAGFHTYRYFYKKESKHKSKKKKKK